MKYFILCLLSVSICISAAPFPDLQKKEYKLAAHAEVTELNRTYLSFNPKFYKEINILRKNLPKNDPLYMDESFGPPREEDIVLGTIDLSGKNDIYYVLLSDFPSYDISYSFYKYERIKNAKSPLEFIEPDFSIFAPSIIIPSNGNVYSYGHNNNSYSLKKKYLYKEGKIVELKQPFNYVGVASSSLKEQTIYSDLSLSSPLYMISKGSPVTIVAIHEDLKNNKEFFVVASEFGLVGYIQIDHSQPENQFSGFYYNGD